MTQMHENIDDLPPFESARLEILDAALMLAAFDGFSEMSLRSAAADAGVDEATLAAAFPKGVRDLLHFWSLQADAAMSEAMQGDEFKSLKIREKVRFAVLARLDYLSPHKEAARRAAALVALPLYVGLAARLSWKTSDAIWRGLGDQSTDFNFYTKRATLTGVWTTTLARWFADETDDEADTKAFLDARIENVMSIEKAKAKARELGLNPQAPIEFLAKLRYGSGLGSRR